MASAQDVYSFLHNSNDDDLKKESRRTILNFLGSFDYILSSESGAEYSYYNATNSQQSIFSSLLQLPWRFLGSVFSSSSSITPTIPTTTPAVPSYQVEIISPASERQIQRSMPTPETSMIEETPEMYTKIVEPHIQTVIDSGSLNWISNVVSGEKERERLLRQEQDFILNVDTKWRSHPNCNEVPRSEWYNHPSTEDLYCLAIASDSSIRSIRDLGRHNVPMLQSILSKGRATIEEVYGVQPDQLRVFVHYQPQFYHFHVHFTRLDNEIGCLVERAHLLSDIIQNLRSDSDFYVKRTITYRLRTSSDLYKQFEKEGYLLSGSSAAN